MFLELDLQYVKRELKMIKLSQINVLMVGSVPLHNPMEGARAQPHLMVCSGQLCTCGQWGGFRFPLHLHRSGTGWEAALTAGENK